MTTGSYKINDHVFSPNGGRTLTEGYLDFEVTDRTINKTLVSDFVIFKRTFSIKWSVAITQDLLEIILAWYTAKQDVTFTKVNKDGTESSYTCRLSIPENFTRVYELKEYSYSDFEISLVEV